MHPNFNEAFLALVIGMGGVLAFLAVLTFITSMITRVWKEPGAAPPAPAPARAAGLAVSPVPAAPPAPRAPAGSEGEAVAAAVAMALHLQGGAAGSEPETAAAIATALALHRARTAAPLESPASPGSPWRLAGSLEAMGARSHRRDRSGSR